MSFSLILSDFKGGFSRWKTWFYLAFLNVKRRYANSVIGPNWTLITNSIFVVCVALLFSGLNSDTVISFGSFLAFGYITWTLLTDFVMTGNSLFLQERRYLNNGGVTLTGIALKFTFTQLLLFAHNIPILVVAFILAKGSLFGLCFALLGYLVLIFNGFFYLLWVGGICARFRDITIAIATVMKLAFFLTPIFWYPDPGGSSIRTLFAKYNPFHYFLTVIRESALEGIVSLNAWLVVLGITFLNVTLSLILFPTVKKQIVYWIQ